MRSEAPALSQDKEGSVVVSLGGGRGYRQEDCLQSGAELNGFLKLSQAEQRLDTEEMHVVGGMARRGQQLLQQLASQLIPAHTTQGRLGGVKQFKSCDYQSHFT